LELFVHQECVLLSNIKKSITSMNVFAWKCETPPTDVVEFLMNNSCVSTLSVQTCGRQSTPTHTHTHTHTEAERDNRAAEIRSHFHTSSNRENRVSPGNMHSGKMRNDAALAVSWDAGCPRAECVCVCVWCRR